MYHKISPTRPENEVVCEVRQPYSPPNYTHRSDTTAELPTIHHYKLVEKMGEGKFGVVFKGVHTKTHESVAVKIETNSALCKMLKHETTVLNILYSKCCRNIPPVYWYGLYNHNYVLVMPCYDMSLGVYLRQLYYKCAPISSIVKIYKTMIHILKHIHKHFVVHRDIKPDNFMLNGSDLVLIDFGFSSFYVDGNGAHIGEESASKNQHLVGSLPYISYNVHCGYSVSRRDDVMSVLYILIYALYGELYWEKNVFWVNSPEYEKTNVCHPTNQHVKSQKCVDLLCSFIEKCEVGAYVDSSMCSRTRNDSLRNTLVELVKYVYRLSFMEMPNYVYLYEALDDFL